MEQRTDKWIADRLGKVTASRVADVIAKTKSGYGASRSNYMAQLVCERLTGTQGELYQNAAMTWGTNSEPAARAHYESVTGLLVEETGFVPHATIANSGASPDGLVEVGSLKGLVEYKCPQTNTHIDTLLSGAIPAKYQTQMQWQLACTGRQFVDFVSFDPRMPENMCYFSERVMRNDDMISELEFEVSKFLAELDEKVSLLKAKYGD
jgi:putative phage-type endonuclease